MKEKTNTLSANAQNIMACVLLHFARVMKGTDYGDDDETRGAMADEGEKYLLNNPAFAVKLYDDYIAGLKTPSVVNGDNKGAEMMRQQIDRLQAERDIIYDAWQEKIKDNPVDEPREDSGEEDSNGTDEQREEARIFLGDDNEKNTRGFWRVTDTDGKQFDIALDDDGVLDIDALPLSRAGELYFEGIGMWNVVIVTDYNTEKTRIVAIFLEDEKGAIKAAKEIEEFGHVLSKEPALTAVEFLVISGLAINPKRARKLNGMSALEFVNGGYHHDRP